MARRQGVKGISLFIVPKILVNENGGVSARKEASRGAIEEKMGKTWQRYLCDELRRCAGFLFSARLTAACNAMLCS